MVRSRTISKAKSKGDAVVYKERRAQAQAFKKRRILSKAQNKTPMGQFSVVPKKMGEAKSKDIPV